MRVRPVVNVRGFVNPVVRGGAVGGAGRGRRAVFVVAGGSVDLSGARVVRGPELVVRAGGNVGGRSLIRVVGFAGVVVLRVGAGFGIKGVFVKVPPCISG